jgi:hypothetical protein
VVEVTVKRPVVVRVPGELGPPGTDRAAASTSSAAFIKAINAQVDADQVQRRRERSGMASNVANLCFMEVADPFASFCSSVDRQQPSEDLLEIRTHRLDFLPGEEVAERTTPSHRQIHIQVTEASMRLHSHLLRCRLTVASLSE